MFYWYSMFIKHFIHVNYANKAFLLNPKKPVWLSILCAEACRIKALISITVHMIQNIKVCYTLINLIAQDLTKYEILGCHNSTYQVEIYALDRLLTISTQRWKYIFHIFLFILWKEIINLFMLDVTTEPSGGNDAYKKNFFFSFFFPWRQAFWPTSYSVTCIWISRVTGYTENNCLK